MGQRLPGSYHVPKTGRKLRRLLRGCTLPAATSGAARMLRHPRKSDVLLESAIMPTFPRRNFMSQVRAWPLTRLLLVCLAWVMVSFAFLLWPLITAFQLVSAEQSGIAAISFPVLSLLGRLAGVIVPPVVLLLIWACRKSKILTGVKPAL